MKMDSISPVFAALGVSGFEALNDLAHWLDVGAEPAGVAETAGWAGGWAEQALRAAAGAAGREG